MTEHTCDTCKHAIIDREYFLIMKGNPITTTVIMCTCDIVKDKYYNRFFKRTKVRVNALNELPPLIGNAHDFCRGIFYQPSEISILDYDPDEDD